MAHLGHPQANDIDPLRSEYLKTAIKNLPPEIVQVATETL